MNWYEVLEKIFELVIYPVIGLVGIYVTQFISTKIDEAKQRTENEKAINYLTIVDEVISKAVLATTQTYVESLKSQNKFDIEAQKVAFKMTYDAVIKSLSNDVLSYLPTVVGDVETYITNKIEATIAQTKNN